ncbi:MAG: DUF3426 domain-containing protein [Acetobacteraceae bacterium]
MKFIRLAVPFTGLVAALTLAGCAAPPPYAVQSETVAPAANIPLPTYYGLYAVDAGTLVRLDGPSEWERRTWSGREDMPTNVSFLAFSRALGGESAPLDQAVTLERVASVRYERTSTGEIITHPVGAVWASPDLPAYQVALAFRPIPSHPDMIIATPNSPLPPGLYSLKVHGAETQDSRFGVAWSTVPQATYGAQNCVEKYPGGYSPCGATVPAGGTMTPAQYSAHQSTGDFVVRNLRSQHLTETNGAPELVIQGELINTSSIPAIMPALAATLLDAQSQVLQALPAVTLPATPLAPGGVYDFRINVANPAPGAANVRVTPTA